MWSGEVVVCEGAGACGGGGGVGGTTDGNSCFMKSGKNCSILNHDISSSFNEALFYMTQLYIMHI